MSATPGHPIEHRNVDPAEIARFDAAASRIGSKANAQVTLFDSTGRVVADNNDFGTSSDPLLALATRSAGTFFSKVPSGASSEPLCFIVE